MTVLRNSFEGGTLGVGLSASNMGGASGDQPNVVTINGTASVVFDNTHVAHDSMAAKWTSATSSLAFVSYTGLGTQECAARCYLYATANSTADYWLIRLEDSAGSAVAIVKWNAAGALRVQDSASATVWTAPAAFPLNQWVRVDLFVDRTNGKIRATQALLDAAPTYDSGLLTANVGANAIDTVKFGDMSTSQVIAAYWADDLAVDPAATDVIPYAPPTVNAGTDQVVTAGDTVTLTSTGTGSCTWTKVSGPTCTITNATSATATVSAIPAGHYVFQAAYSGGGSDTVAVAAATATAVPETQVSNAGSWTGTAASLGDGSDATYIESVDGPSGAVTVFLLQPLTAGAKTATVRVAASDTASAVTGTVELLNGPTGTAFFSMDLGTVTTAVSQVALALTTAQVAAITDLTNVHVRFTAS